MIQPGNKRDTVIRGIACHLQQPKVRDMVRRIASLSMLAPCLVSLFACVAAPVAPGYDRGVGTRPRQRLALGARPLGLIAHA
jgi:hypothetical protein